MKHINKFNEGIESNEKSGKWFFGNDGDGHSYLIPFELRDKWIEMTMNDFDDDDYDGIEKFEKIFGEHRLGGGIESYVFENPKEIR